MIVAQARVRRQQQPGAGTFESGVRRMSRQRRKKNKRSGHPAGPSPVKPQTHSLSPNGTKRKSQTVLLFVACLLLGLAALVNLKRLSGDLPAPPIPMPVEEIAGRPLSAPGTSKARRFVALPASATGVDFVHPVDDAHPMSYLYFSSTASGGTAVGDVSGDGRPDIFIAGGPGRNRLYVQQGEAFVFKDVTSRAGVDGGDAWACGATMVDINADGWLDLFVANYDSPNQLFVNQGNGTFQNRAAEYGLNITDASLEGAFADYDRDGDLDLYLVTYRYENPAGMPEKPPLVYAGGERKIHADFAKFYETTDDSIGYGTVGRSDGLLRNNGDGTFSNVTFAAGIRGHGHGQSATWWDFNNDGLVDLHVGNDFNDPDRLYQNNGDGTFSDVIRDAVPHTTWFSMGADVGDVDGDGRADLLSADMSSTTHFKQKTTMGSMGKNIDFLTNAVPRQYMRNALLLNTGTHRFQEAAYLTGLDSTDWTWCVKLADFDCDGILDVFFTNGSVRSFTDSDRTLTLRERMGKTEWDLYKDTAPLREKNLAFRGRGRLRFDDVSAEWGLDHLGVSMAAAHADFDGDGDLDLVVSNMDEPVVIYRNDSAEHRRLTLRLHGRGANRFGVGAKVRLTAGHQKQVKELHPSRGFLASNEPILHFGCGEANSVDLQITWPNGGVQVFEDLATDQHYEVVELDGLPVAVDESFSPMFANRFVAGIDHQENEFDDYGLQPLLPHRMSRLGPAIAAADVDDDGDIDYFVGGASGQPGRIILKGDGTSELSLSVQPALDADKAMEDMGAVWLDVERDGDVDLFVASGGNEHEVGSDPLRLRLYLNDGGGNLVRSKRRCPDVRVSAGPLAAADFDADGDVDLFVGGRQIPGQYPLPADSYLLLNQDGAFEDHTSRLAPAMRQLGMVTGAVWTDVDNDTDLDLLVTTEWGPIRLFRNRDGVLAEDSASAGLTAYQGWWTGISGGDFDRDGDIDYVATNLGTNTKYHATDEHPFRLFYGDFDGSGKRRLVEAEYENETLFPVRGKSCSTHAMPSLGEKFTTYRAFAAASLEEIYTPECLDDSYQCSANWLQSVVLLNDGSGTFQVKPLPVEAQLSPGFGVAVAEFTGDGVPDLFVAQNFFSPQPETGNMDGGLGCVLNGNGDGTFSAISPRESGVVIPGDAAAALAVQINGDHAPDLLVATNNGALHLLESQSTDGRDQNSIIEVTILGVRSVSEIAGTRVEFRSAGQPVQLMELASGSGYLSQAAPLLYFAVDAELEATLRVRWPDGRTMESTVPPGTKRYPIAYSTVTAAE